MTFQELLQATPYSLPQSVKEKSLLVGLNQLMNFHYEKCVPYKEIVNRIWGGRVSAKNLEEIPYLPVSLFKSHQLRSVSEEAVRVTLTSSGTTGQSVSRIAVDAETSMRQMKALSASLSHILGPKRLPMLIIDTDAAVKDPQLISARGAGILGLMRYGHHHVFVLNEDLSPNRKAIGDFLGMYGKEPFLIFGFTYMVWLNLVDAFQGKEIDLSKGILLHSGGWKKLADQAVDNVVFRNRLKEAFGLQRIYNFYGMAEQLGSIFLEGGDGLLHPPNFSDVIIRNPQTWEPQPVGSEGIIQVLSLIPLSYPGHSLLTEDIGVIESIDAGADDWRGKALRIIGRVKKAELRGCSDMLAQKICEA